MKDWDWAPDGRAATAAVRARETKP
jgi:hypothetical protein